MKFIIADAGVKNKTDLYQMKTKSTRHHNSKKLPSPSINYTWLWLTVIVLVVMAMGVVFWRNYSAKQVAQEVNTTPLSNNVPSQPIQDLLIGRWVRTDSNGNYIIEIKSVATTGSLEASYFNPNPIKVGHATWQKKISGLIVIIELRDVNYPGSTYTLSFNVTEDMLTGNYYQAVEGTNFDVAFARVK